MEKVGRRTFLQLGVAAIISFFLVLWNKLTLNHLQEIKQKTKIFPFNKNKSISFTGNYIVINKKENTTVLSAHCTHLGCIINQTEDGKLVCPCHGSEYDLSGKVIKGPAYKNLEIIPSEITPDGNHIEING